MQKIKFCNVKWIFKDKNKYNNHIILNFKKLYIYGKFQCTSLINSTFDDFFLEFYFDTILTFF